MQNKLQELTDKLYNEGLSKGKQEAEQLKANAKEEAAQIIAQAKEQAQEILAKAQAEAAELKSKTENDVKMAAAQTFTAVKQQIENAIVTKALAPVKGATSETEFLKEIVKTVVAAFNPANTDSVALEVILPAEKKAEMEKFAAESLNKICSAGVEVQFSKTIQGGFKIAPKGEGYMLSFTDKDFENIISEYLRPKTKALLF
jgi:V/A-type H+-transporting ATPase subunit E